MIFHDYFVDAFDGLSLHNGTTVKARGRIEEPARALVQILTLPDGTKYDNMPAATIAPLVPGTITTEIFIKEATKAASQTTLNNIAAKLGKRGTITAQEVGSLTFVTATARMTGIRNITPGLDSSYILIAVTFELLTNF